MRDGLGDGMTSEPDGRTIGRRRASAAGVGLAFERSAAASAGRAARRREPTGRGSPAPSAPGWRATTTAAPSARPTTSTTTNTSDQPGRRDAAVTAAAGSPAGGAVAGGRRRTPVGWVTPESAGVGWRAIRRVGSDAHAGWSRANRRCPRSRLVGPGPGAPVGVVPAPAAAPDLGSARRDVPQWPQKLCAGVGRPQFGQRIGGPISISAASWSRPRWITARSQMSASDGEQRLPEERRQERQQLRAERRRDQEQQREDGRDERDGRRAQASAVPERRAVLQPEGARGSADDARRDQRRGDRRARAAGRSTAASRPPGGGPP